MNLAIIKLNDLQDAKCFKELHNKVIIASNKDDSLGRMKKFSDF